jgi:protein-disulfide isomerase
MENSMEEEKLQHHTTHSEPKAVITIRKDQFLIGFAIAMLVVGFAGGYFIHDFTGGGTTTQPTPQANTTQQPTQNPAAPVKVSIDATDPVMGSADAKLTIIEFSDPSCPFCGGASGFNQQVVQYLQGKDPTWTAPEPGIITDFVKTGKVKLIFKYYPGHGSGAEAMKLALCANEQGKFWEAHDIFFSNQDKMNDTAALEGLMGNISGIDATKLKGCYDAKKYDDALQADIAAGTAAGMQGTPSFYIGTEKAGYKAVVGAQSYKTLKTTIDAALA